MKCSLFFSTQQWSTVLMSADPDLKSQPQQIWVINVARTRRRGQSYSWTQVATMQQGSQARSALHLQEEVTAGTGKVSPHQGSNTIYSVHNLSQSGEDSEPKTKAVIFPFSHCCSLSARQRLWVYSAIVNPATGSSALSSKTCLQ